MTTLFRIFDFNQSTLLILGLTLSLSLVSESGRGQDALLTTAETVLRYQRLTGGWPKNYDFSRHLAKSEQQKLLEQKKNNDSTIDNGATYREIKILAQAYRLKKDPRFRLSAIEGIEYLLAAQYQNGGWPQTFPNPTGYHRYITYNDNAMIGVLQLLNDISQGNSLYSFTSLNLRRRCQAAVAKGIECILRCQIRVGENRLVWCAQHDHQTLAPRSARSYELASLSGNESVEIIRFLMEIDDPDRRIVKSIESAISWFQKAKLEGIRLVRRHDPDSESGFDKVVVADPKAPPLWARFYEINSNQPFFCGRDGIAKKTIADISHERRNGYSWLGEYGKKLLQQDYPAWKNKNPK